MPPEPRALAERLVQFWSRSNLDVRPGLKNVDLEAFERRHGVSLPDDFREYFLIVDGMAPDQLDPANYFRFWPLGEVTPIDMSAEAPGYFEFADMSIGAYIYAIRLGGEPGNNVVGVVTDANVRQVASSFSDFIRGYLDEPSRIF